MKSALVVSPRQMIVSSPSRSFDKESHEQQNSGSSVISFWKMFTPSSTWETYESVLLRSHRCYRVSGCTVRLRLGRFESERPMTFHTPGLRLPLHFLLDFLSLAHFASIMPLFQSHTAARNNTVFSYTRFDCSPMVLLTVPYCLFSPPFLI
jgi:hypothetical protein